MSSASIRLAAGAVDERGTAPRGRHELPEPLEGLIVYGLTTSSSSRPRSSLVARRSTTVLYPALRFVYSRGIAPLLW